MKTMKAAWYEKLGKANQVLQIGDMPTPQVKPNEVLIRLHASGINPADVKKRMGMGISKTLQYPTIPHSDGAGTIEQVGSGVSPDRIRQRVWLYHYWKRQFGTAAQFITVPEQCAIPLPDHISFKEGACLGLPVINAYHCVFVNGSMQGKNILVTGETGNVGHYAIQFAKQDKAKVIVIVNNMKNSKSVKQAGADHILEYSEENIVDMINEITDNNGVDRIIDIDYKPYLPKNHTIFKKVLKTNGGRISVFRDTQYWDTPNGEVFKEEMMFNDVNVYTLQSEKLEETKNYIQEMLEKDPPLIHTIAAEFTLDNIIEAHELVESEKNIGNVILTIDHD